MSYTPPPPPPPPPPPGGAYPAGGASPDPLGRPLAQGWERLVAGLIDGVIIGVVAGIVNVLARNLIVSLGVGFVVATIYYAVMSSETTKGQTVGKMVLGMATVDQGTGSFIDMSKAGIRGVVYGALAWICCIGAIVEAVLVFTDKRAQTIHDKAAGTLVVKVK